ncbi:MAG: glutamine-hydrolyzing carbamoyl-phosphate synthase small subunit [Pseudomonadota bacterium]
MLEKPAILALEDGSVFRGTALGAEGNSVGEIVFNTSLTGYQEILSDPSYASQVVVLTYPHIGNVGVNADDQESKKCHLSGLVIRNASPCVSNWRAQESLDSYLKRSSVVGISDIDTRRLTRILRTKGVMGCCIQSGDTIDEANAIQQAKDFAGLSGKDLVKDLTTSKSYRWQDTSWSHASDKVIVKDEIPALPVVVVDFGVKSNILRMLVDRGCEVTVVPATASLSDVLSHKPKGVVLSNGPGDPEALGYAIQLIQELLKQKIPLYGICLGHQLLGLAAGARTIKMKFGHHGANHPVQDIATKQVMITSQNHGFTIDENSLPLNVRITHRSLFDQSIQGIEIEGANAFSFQGHPEAGPGPKDVSGLFDRFIREII